ncbi:hypothetical protein [Alistipes putredinis]|uniref:hypothetical protein n=1 Tax=Alistipes putredinis TaxID=28117 RepID=UPI003AB4A4EE
MREFDLAAAKAGAAVCTRDGQDVVPVAVDSLLQGPYVFSGIVGFGDVYPDKRVVETWTEEGLPTSLTVGQCGLSLMMRDDDYAEKMERGEYGNHIEDKPEKVDREHLRRELSEKIMVAMIRELAGKSPHSTSNNITVFEAMAADAVSYADALLEELEKTEKKL